MTECGSRQSDKLEFTVSERKQEKIGWIAGWLGGFIWVVILSIVLLVKGYAIEAGAGVLVASVACITIVLLSPWRHPQTRYRLLMVPIYLLFFVAVGWGAWSWGGWQQMGISSWWSALILLPILIPFWTVGNRRWDDGGQDQVGLNQ